MMNAETKKTLMDNAEFAKRLNVWLSYYTDKVCEEVMKKIDIIRNDDTTLQILEKLYQASISKEEESERAFRIMLNSNCEYINIHDDSYNGKSFRDVLYELYIK